MSATVIGGYLVWKFRPTAKFLIASMIAMEAVSALGFILLMIPKCDKVEMANFGLNREGLILDSECNFNCTCTTKAFSPICGSDGRTVFFTPCFAGCKENVNQTRILKRDRRATLAHIAADFSDGASTSVSVRTVQRTVINMGSQSRRPTRAPLLTARHKALLLSWARQHYHWTVDDWKHVAWSDESRFQLYRTDARVREWRRHH
ncbi:hypothetical protein AVEN_235610-1 [Araneus ventricosus]|uniref:Kazal-like domain-containing protein n=1 Tax=Araneus ventricosus TaxID=182803 RepID=A0A4Y2BRD3_ARAVE|nr:hypothetical protein AVEN_235610-1 [Araneus ventricosus]